MLCRQTGKWGRPVLCLVLLSLFLRAASGTQCSRVGVPPVLCWKETLIPKNRGWETRETEERSRNCFVASYRPTPATLRCIAEADQEPRGAGHTRGASGMQQHQCGMRWHRGATRKRPGGGMRKWGRENRGIAKSRQHSRKKTVKKACAYILKCCSPFLQECTGHSHGSECPLRELGQQFESAQLLHRQEGIEWRQSQEIPARGFWGSRADSEFYSALCWHRRLCAWRSVLLWMKSITSAR